MVLTDDLDCLRSPKMEWGHSSNSFTYLGCTAKWGEMCFLSEPLMIEWAEAARCWEPLGHLTAVRFHVSSKKNSRLRGKVRSDFVRMELTLELYSDDGMGFEGVKSNHPVFKRPDTVLLFPILESLSEKGRRGCLATILVSTVFELWTSACLLTCSHQRT